MPDHLELQRMMEEKNREIGRAFQSQLVSLPVVHYRLSEDCPRHTIKIERFNGVEYLLIHPDSLDSLQKYVAGRLQPLHIPG